jgi:lipoate-protein ligase A
MYWRLINHGFHNAYFNMALDEAISDSVRNNLSPPSLRLYQWSEPSITIGYFQHISDLNLVYCKRKNYPVVRRLTGGKAIMHDTELTYSFSARFEDSRFKNSIMKNYLSLHRALLLALQFTNIDAEINLKKGKRTKSPLCFNVSSYGEVTVRGEKLIGSSQRRYSNGFLQQGSILRDVNISELLKILRLQNSENTPCKITAVKDHFLSVSQETLKIAVTEAFEKYFGITFTCEHPTEFELDFTKQLIADKYSKQIWNFRR